MLGAVGSNKISIFCTQCPSLVRQKCSWAPVLNPVSRLNYSRKILIYIAILFAFRAAIGNSPPERPKLIERMSPIPEVIVDALLARFTESARGSSKCVLVRLE